MAAGLQQTVMEGVATKAVAVKVSGTCVISLGSGKSEFGCL